MSYNKYKPHVLIYPEDDANREIANGCLFAPRLKPSALTAIQIMPPAGGWMKVVEKLETSEEQAMNRYPGRILVLLIDFDGRISRLDRIRQKVSESLRERVFVLGVLSEPEKLRSMVGGGSYEKIGYTLVEECPDSLSDLWNHPLLRHNRDEVRRLMARVNRLLFDCWVLRHIWAMMKMPCKQPN